jgi:bacterioferritin-associated ferredoxin
LISVVIIVINIDREVMPTMIVCVCHGVSDRTIDCAIDEGCRSVRQVGRSCRAGTDCGACRGAIKDMVREASVERVSVSTSGLIPAMGVV